MATIDSNPETINASDCVHPQYTKQAQNWAQMRDTYEGEQVVKAKGEVYLPKTAGQEQDPNGNTLYSNYKTRSIFWDYVNDTVQDMLGLINKEPVQYVLPTQLEDWSKEAGADGESLKVLYRAVNEQQLIVSRVGLVLDPPERTDIQSLPRINRYEAETILTWDDQNKPPRWVILDESHYEAKNFKYEIKNEYRLLALDGADQYYTITFDKFPSLDDVSQPIVAEDPANPSYGEAVYPELNGKRFNKIPIQIINAASLSWDTERPMMLGLSNIALASYRGEADYRLALFMQAQETLFLKGFLPDEGQNIRVGAGASVSSVGEQADMKFVGVSGSGLEEMRESQGHLDAKAQDMGVQLKEKSGVESGDALITRLTVRTATMATVAETAAMGIRNIIQMAMEWAGMAGIKDVEVIAPTDFTDSAVDTKAMIDVVSAVERGMFTLEDYHSWLSKNDYTADQFDEWQEKLATAMRANLGFSDAQQQ